MGKERGACEIIREDAERKYQEGHAQLINNSLEGVKVNCSA